MTDYYLSNYGNDDIALNQATLEAYNNGPDNRVIIDVNAFINNYLWPKTGVDWVFTNSSSLTKNFNTVGDWSIFHLNAIADDWSFIGGTVKANDGVTGKLALFNGDNVNVDYSDFYSKGGGFAVTHVGDNHEMSNFKIFNDNGSYGDDGLHISAGDGFNIHDGVIYSSDDAIGVSGATWQGEDRPIINGNIKDVEGHSSLARVISIGIARPDHTGEVAHWLLQGISGSGSGVQYRPVIILENQGLPGLVYDIVIKDSEFDALGSNPFDIDVLKINDYELDNVTLNNGENSMTLLQQMENGVIENFTYNYDTNLKLIGGTDDNDTIVTKNGSQIIASGLGRDYVDAGSGNDTVWGSFGDDTIKGGSGNDSLNGGYGNDLIFGDGGSDVIFGSYGNDTIYGGSAIDTIYGGMGNDVFYVSHSDVIMDYNPSNDIIIYV